MVINLFIEVLYYPFNVQRVSSYLLTFLILVMCIFSLLFCYPEQRIINFIYLFKEPASDSNYFPYCFSVFCNTNFCSIVYYFFSSTALGLHWSSFKIQFSNILTSNNSISLYTQYRYFITKSSQFFPSLKTLLSFVGYDDPIYLIHVYHNIPSSENNTIFA